VVIQLGGEVLINPHRKTLSCYEIFIQKASYMDWYLAQNRDMWRVLVNVVINLQFP
jgi:hypothetical protein